MLYTLYRGGSERVSLSSVIVYLRIIVYVHYTIIIVPTNNCVNNGIPNATTTKDVAPAIITYPLDNCDVRVRGAQTSSYPWVLLGLCTDVAV